MMWYFVCTAILLLIVKVRLVLSRHGLAKPSESSDVMILFAIAGLAELCVYQSDGVFSGLFYYATALMLSPVIMGCGQVSQATSRFATRLMKWNVGMILIDIICFITIFINNRVHAMWCLFVCLAGAWRLRRRRGT